MNGLGFLDASEDDYGLMEEDDHRALSHVPLSPRLQQLVQVVRPPYQLELMVCYPSQGTRTFFQGFSRAVGVGPHWTENLLHKDSSHHGFLERVHQEPAEVMANRGASGSSGSKWTVGLSRDENFTKHNLNSAMRTDYSKEERMQQKIEKLRQAGVHKKYLKVDYVIPVEKQGQGPEIDPINRHSLGLINAWAASQVNYLYLKIFAEASSQVAGNMAGIIKFIEEELKPTLQENLSRIIDVRGDPVMAPNYFAGSALEHFHIPAAPSKGKKKV